VRRRVANLLDDGVHVTIGAPISRSRPQVEFARPLTAFVDHDVLLQFEQRTHEPPPSRADRQTRLSPRHVGITRAPGAAASKQFELFWND
jgi:hypothetical protein